MNQSSTGRRRLPIKTAAFGLECHGRCAIGVQRNLQIALDLGLKLRRLHPTELQSYPHIQLHVDIIRAGILIVLVVGSLVASQRHQLLPLEHGVQGASVLVRLVEGIQFHGLKPLALVECIGLDPIVVNPDPLVGVPDGHVEGQVVVEGVVGVGQVELSQLGVVCVELDLVGAEDQPQDQDDYAQDDDDGAEDLEDATEDAIAEAAAATAEGVATAAAAASGAVVVLWWWNGWAIIGSVQVWLRHALADSDYSERQREGEREREKETKLYWKDVKSDKKVGGVYG